MRSKRRRRGDEVEEGNFMRRRRGDEVEEERRLSRNFSS
jgi:hypothetical protein